MSYLIFGFLTGLSLILAIGAQNIFVIEQGLKKKHVFIVCLICSLSDFILIFLGIFLFHHFQSFFSPLIELILNLLLLLFLINFIWRKLKSINNKISINKNSDRNTFISTVLKTLGLIKGKYNMESANLMRQRKEAATWLKEIDAKLAKVG